MAIAQGDTATLNLQGGWLDTYYATIGGHATFNLINPGSYWDSTDVLINGDQALTAGIGVGLGAQAVAHGNLVVGSNTGSGQVVVDGTTTGFNPPAQWIVNGSVDVGPTNTGSMYYGMVTLQDGGRMTVNGNVRVHGHTDDVLWSTISVQTGGALTVTDLLQIGPYATLELSESASKITTGSFAKTGSGAIFDWTAGTLEITNEIVNLDTFAPNPVWGSTLTVGAGKKLIASLSGGDFESLRVGEYGTGSLVVEAGGDIEAYWAIVGLTGTSHGVATVRDSGSTWTITDQLRIGSQDNGHGELNVHNGGFVSTGLAVVGYGDNAYGIVTVNGFNSSLTSTGNLWIADGGTATGTLTVENQGTVTSAAAAIGRSGSPTGNAIVDGANSTWNIAGSMTVGNNTGGSGTLTVRNSGKTTVGGTLTVNAYGTVNLSRAGQIRADAILLQPGAMFDDRPGTVVLANSLAGFGDHANFDGHLGLGISEGAGVSSHSVGVGQTLSVGGGLWVGYDAPASLSIYGQVNMAGVGIVGGGVGGGGDSVLVSGSLASWQVGNLYIGGDETAAQNSAELRVTNGAQVILVDSVTVWWPGQIVLDGGLVSADSVVVEGSLLGDGIILLGGGATTVTNRELVAPGGVSSSDILTINGMASSAHAYEQEGTGRLLIDIGGSNYFQYDHIDVVGGSAMLAGNLIVSLIDPLGGDEVFVPSAGDSFEILTAEEVLGTFDSESFPAIPGKPGLEWLIDYDRMLDHVLLSVAPIFAADFDEDGDVDHNDLTIWQAGYGTGTLHTEGDADGDFDVDGRDFLWWQRQFGSASPLTANVSVPESGALTLMMGVSALLAFTRRN